MTDNKLIISRANAAVIARDFSLAARLYKTLLNDDPTNADLLKKLGSVYQKAGNDEQALSVYKRISNDADAANEMGAIYRRMKRFDESVAVLEQALVCGGDKVKINYNLGFTYRQMGEFAAAIGCFEEVLNENPNDVLVFNHIGAIHAERGEHNRAVAAYLRGLKIDQNHPILNLNIAKSYEKLGKIRNACSSYEAALRSKPGMLEAVEGYSNLLIKEDRIKEAYEVVNNAVRLNPENVEMRVKLGNVYEKQSNYEKAEDQYEAALEQNDTYIPALFGLATTQEQLGRYEDAVRTMRRAEEMNPGDAVTLKKSAHVLMSANYLPAAYDKISKLIQQNRDDVETLNLMGQYYICTGETENRDSTYQRIEALNPLYYDHYREGGIRYSNNGDMDNAELFMNKVLVKNPQDIAALLVLGQIYEKSNQIDKAAEMYKKVCAIEGSNIIAKNAMERLNIKPEPVPEPVQDPVEEVQNVDIEEMFDSNGLEINLTNDIDQSIEEVAPPAEDIAPVPAEDDGFDFEQFGMENLIEEENEDVNPLVFEDDNSIEKEPFDSEDDVQNLDDLLDSDIPVDAEDDSMFQIPNGNKGSPFEEENLDEVPVEEETSAPVMAQIPPESFEASINPEDLETMRELSEKAEKALEKANLAAEKAMDAAKQAEEALQNIDQNPDIEEPLDDMDDFIEDAKLGLDSLEEEETEENAIDEILDPREMLLERATKMLPSIIRVISDKETAEKFKSALEMFKKLRELLEFLPERKKQEFLQSETRLLLDYVIAKLSGLPGLFGAAKSLRDGGLVKADEDFVEEAEGIELTRKVLDQLCLLVSYIDDNNLRAILMQIADGLYEKL